jgi:hypothetical protein
VTVPRISLATHTARRELIDERLGVRCTNLFGLSEIIGPGVSGECAEERAGMHVVDDFLIVENLYMQFLKPAGTAPHKSMLDALPTDRPIVVSAAVSVVMWVSSFSEAARAGLASFGQGLPGGGCGPVDQAAWR